MSTRSYRLLWIAVKHLPGGEPQLRDLVAALNDRDGTNAAAKGSDEYSSTKALSDAQFNQLLDQVVKEAKLPKAPRRARRRRLPAEVATTVVFLATQEELVYVVHLFDLLRWGEEARAGFVLRQTKHPEIKTHWDASRVIEPLERMLKRKGFSLDEGQGKKVWRAPA